MGRIATAFVAISVLGVVSGFRLSHVSPIRAGDHHLFGKSATRLCGKPASSRDEDIERTRKVVSGHDSPKSTGNGNDEAVNSKKKRSRVWNKLGIHRLSKIRKKEQKEEPEQIFPVTKTGDLDEYFEDKQKRFRDKNGNIDYDKLLASLSVIGNTQIIGSPDHPDTVHPVLKLLHTRRKTGSKCVEGSRPDGHRVALAVEGGGMRGCVSAGMVAAINYLGLDESFDVVYGSSAGSIIGSYFITGQLPWFGPEIYYDSLTTAGRTFIDSRRLLRAIGAGLLDPRLVKDVIFRPGNGKPVLNLSFLLKTTAIERKPLDWERFVERQKVLPLKVVASGLKSEKPLIMDMEKGSFQSLEELTNCMHASCLLPGIAGPVMNIRTGSTQGDNGERSDQQDNFVIANNFGDDTFEPAADALLYEPLPYQSAIDEGATHVVVLRTRPDGVDTTGKSSIFERLIFKRFFLKKNKLANMYKRVRMHLHKYVYGKSVLELNEAAVSDRDYNDLSAPHLMAVALPPGSEEVTRLETGREAIFEGVRRGFARAYDALVEDPAERGRGAIVAKQYFPDEILDYDPLTMETSHKFESAFDAFLAETKETPKIWRDSGHTTIPDAYPEPK
jgi:predicted acylesterase/phospholipase RssA